MSLRPIKDIRFFEGAAPSEPGRAPFNHLGTLYPAADRFQIAVAGDRYALALAAAGFQTRTYDHVYVTLTPALPPDEAHISTLELERWMVIVNVGLPAERWPSEAAAQYAVLIRCATLALQRLCARDELDGSVLPEVEREVAELGEDLELVRLRKATKGYRVTVSYRIRPLGSGSPVFLEYLDCKTGRSGKIELLRVTDFEDVFALFASVAISEGTIVLSPRSTAAAQYTIRKYKSPFRVSVDRMLQGTPGC